MQRRYKKLHVIFVFVKGIVVQIPATAGESPQKKSYNLETRARKQPIALKGRGVNITKGEKEGKRRT
jgi:hypothetical protein